GAAPDGNPPGPAPASTAGPAAARRGWRREDRAGPADLAELGALPATRRPARAARGARYRPTGAAPGTRFRRRSARARRCGIARRVYAGYHGARSQRRDQGGAAPVELERTERSAHRNWPAEVSGSLS